MNRVAVYFPRVKRGSSRWWCGMFAIGGLSLGITIGGCLPRPAETSTKRSDRILEEIYSHHLERQLAEMTNANR